MKKPQGGSNNLRFFECECEIFDFKEDFKEDFTDIRKSKTRKQGHTYLTTFDNKVP